MSRMQGNHPHPSMRQGGHPMKMTFPSQFRLDFSLSLIFAAAYSAFPKMKRAGITPEEEPELTIHGQKIPDTCAPTSTLKRGNWSTMLGMTLQRTEPKVLNMSDTRLKSRNN